MPKKTSFTEYRHPNADFIVSAFEEFSDRLPSGYSAEVAGARVDRERHSWTWATLGELVADVSDNENFRGLYARFQSRDAKGNLGMGHEVLIESGRKSTTLSTLSPTRSEVDQLHSKLLNLLNTATNTQTGDDVPNIFIAHGGNDQWKDLKNHLSDQQGFKVTAFETGDRAGHHIRDILDGELDSNNFAFLIMTAEDEQADGTFRARQNVVHEAGLFQGRLGFSKAVILREEGVEMFSNVAGITYIPFDRGNIRSAFGDAVATVRAAFNMK